MEQNFDPFFEYEKESNSESAATNTSEINQRDESNNTFDTDDDELSETIEIKRSMKMFENFNDFIDSHTRDKSAWDL